MRRGYVGLSYQGNASSFIVKFFFSKAVGKCIDVNSCGGGFSVYGAVPARIDIACCKN